MLGNAGRFQGHACGRRRRGTGRPANGALKCRHRDAEIRIACPSRCVATLDHDGPPLAAERIVPKVGGLSWSTAAHRARRGRADHRHSGFVPKRHGSIADRAPRRDCNVIAMLYRACGQGWWPCRIYSITSSARARNKDGIVRPSALAVLRLTTNSYFVGSWIGRSPGLAPFKMRST
jgi:hypothetical protein